METITLHEPLSGATLEIVNKPGNAFALDRFTTKVNGRPYQLLSTVPPLRSFTAFPPGRMTNPVPYTDADGQRRPADVLSEPMVKSIARIVPAYKDRGIIHGPALYVPHETGPLAATGEGISLTAVFDADTIPGISPNFNGAMLKTTTTVTRQGRLKVNLNVINKGGQIINGDAAIHFWFKAGLDDSNPDIAGQRAECRVGIPAKAVWRAEDQWPTGELDAIEPGSAVDFTRGRNIGNVGRDNWTIGQIYYAGSERAHYYTIYNPAADITIVIKADKEFANVSFFVPDPKSDSDSICLFPMPGPADKEKIRAAGKVSEDKLGRMLGPGESNSLTIEIWAESGDVSGIEGEPV